MNKTFHIISEQLEISKKWKPAGLIFTSIKSSEFDEEMEGKYRDYSENLFETKEKADEFFREQMKKEGLAESGG